MIKVIAFDLVGVLVNERDIVLSNEEEKLERLFGPNLSDEEYLKEANKIVNDETNILYITRALINKLYKVKDREIFKKVKEINSDVKIVIATNHVSFVKEFISSAYITCLYSVIDNLYHIEFITLTINCQVVLQNILHIFIARDFVL